MTERLNNDATPTIAGIVYQFYVALDKCYDLKSNEKLWFEKYGDITLSSEKQIEVKKFQRDLTDLDENIWKTLNNWLQDNFEPNYYKELILLTTQEFGANSSFKKWNTQSSNDKKKILEQIAHGYSKKPKKDTKTENLIKAVLDKKQYSKLENILKKFIILDSSLKEKEYYSDLVRRHARQILIHNQKQFINSLLGFIICPDSMENNWEITNEAFTVYVQTLDATFGSGTVLFPQRQIPKVTDRDYLEKKECLFVKKIEDIKYKEVLHEAISYYIHSRNIIMEELKHRFPLKEYYENYEIELENQINPLYRKALRSVTEKDIIEKSQDFYDEIMSLPVQNFIQFNNTPISYRNGVIQNMADNKNKNIVWKLDNKESND